MVLTNPYAGMLNFLVLLATFMKMLQTKLAVNKIPETPTIVWRTEVHSLSNIAMEY